MDFALSAKVLDLKERVERFIESEVIPLERSTGPRPPAADALRAIREKAKKEKLWAPHLPAELGGQGLEFFEACPVFEAAGRSLLGPLCLGCAAPDEGNSHLLYLAGTELQKEKYLKPLVAGEIRSTFAMTEPAPGAGSDPSMMRTRATRDGKGWRLDGDKWFATGAAGARFAIVAAVSNAEAEFKNALTLFIVDAGTPGFEVLREIPVIGGGIPGGHCEIQLRGCRVPEEQVLGTIGKGSQLIQARLGPARLTHCMRWLGAATRAFEIASRRAKEREAFGKLLGEHEAVGWMLADSATEIHASRLMVYEAAWRISKGDQARVETSMCKVFVAETVNRVIDRAIQICGALGLTDDLPLAHFYQEARAFRIYDGPSEVHRMVIAKRCLPG
jgi:acyl-CoA dehydrogenase